MKTTGFVEKQKTDVKGELKLGRADVGFVCPRKQKTKQKQKNSKKGGELQGSRADVRFADSRRILCHRI